MAENEVQVWHSKELSDLEFCPKGNDLISVDQEGSAHGTDLSTGGFWMWLHIHPFLASRDPLI